MEIGSKIKSLRQRSNLTQEELADRCELTKGYISQLENDLTSPSIATLEDIVAALGTRLVELFADDADTGIVYSSDDYLIKETDTSKITWLINNSTINEMEPIIVELNPNGVTDIDKPHEGEEFGYIIYGSVTLVLGSHKYKINCSDSFYFKADRPHYIINDDCETKLLWVSSPPNF